MKQPYILPDEETIITQKGGISENGSSYVQIDDDEPLKKDHTYIMFLYKQSDDTYLISGRNSHIYVK